MANYTFGARVICPFYLKEAGKSITCEGLAEGTTNMMRFTSEAEKQRFQELNCEMHNYEFCCPMAAAIMRTKYSEEASTRCITPKNRSR